MVHQAWLPCQNISTTSPTIQVPRHLFPKIASGRSGHIQDATPIGLATAGVLCNLAHLLPLWANPGSVRTHLLCRYAKPRLG